MQTALDLIRLLPWIDWIALAAFLAGWVGYVHFARQRSHRQPSVLASSNRIRRQWMVQAMHREVRVFDGVVIQSLSSSPSFFASTSILVIGGLLAVLGTSEKATELVREIPFAARTSELVFDLKVVLMLVIFVFAFFRFTWSMRLYTFGALMVAAAPESRALEAQGAEGEAWREAFADRAGRVVGIAAETFNDGLRAYYFAFAAIGWFFSPLLFVLATAVVVYILYQREFRSEVLGVLRVE